jgi:hypothetical protein
VVWRRNLYETKALQGKQVKLAPILGKEEFLAIKVGDQWFDSSRNFIGTAIEIKEDCLYWTWKSLRDGTVIQCDRNRSTLLNKKNDISWIMLTPLLKELL